MFSRFRTTTSQFLDPELIELLEARVGSLLDNVQLPDDETPNEPDEPR